MKSWIFLLTLSLSLAACQSKTSDKGNTGTDTTKTAPAVEQPLKLSWEVKVISDGQDGSATTHVLFLLSDGKKIGVDTSIFSEHVDVPTKEEYKKLNIPDDAIFAGGVGGMDDYSGYYLKRKGENLEIWRRLAGLGEDGEIAEGKWEVYKTVKLSDFK